MESKIVFDHMFFESQACSPVNLFDLFYYWILGLENNFNERKCFVFKNYKALALALVGISVISIAMTHFRTRRN